MFPFVLKGSSFRLVCLISFMSFIFCLIPLEGETHGSCGQALEGTPQFRFKSAWALHGLLPETKVFGFTRPGRRKEIQKLEAELKELEGKIDQILQKTPELKESLELWGHFTDYWQVKTLEFMALPPKEQKKLAPSLELPLSLALKHFIAFFKAPNHRSWNMERLFEILTVHKKYPQVDLETALFLINRETMRFYSRWDFVNCRY